MKPWRWLACILGGALICVLFMVKTTEGALPPLPENKHIFIISIDGLSSEAYASLKYGALQSLAEQGVISEKSIAVRDNKLVAGEVSLLTGRNPEDHGAQNEQDQVDAESLFDVMRKQHKSILVVDGTGGALKFLSHGSRQYLKVTEKNDLEVMKQAVQTFSREKPYLTYVYLGQPRKALEKRDKEAYYIGLDYSQQAVGYLMHRLQLLGIADYCMVVVTSARGSTSSDLVPIIIKAPGVKEETKIDGMKVTDVVGTICAFNSLSNPYGSSGVIPWSIIKTAAPASTVYYQEKQIKELYRDRLDINKQYYRLQDHRDSLVKELDRASKEKESIFDFVGQRDQTVTQLKKRLVITKSAFYILMGVFLLGYYLEYRILRKKFTLF